MQKSMNKLYILGLCGQFFVLRFMGLVKMFLVKTKKINKSAAKLWYN